MLEFFLAIPPLAKHISFTIIEHFVLKNTCIFLLRKLIMTIFKILNNINKSVQYLSLKDKNFMEANNEKNG